MDIAQLDLNLLVVLDALLEEEHVTRAAQRVGLSQSATSRALARLRDAFEDPLLIKTHRGMKATPRALALRSKLRIILEGVGALLEEEKPFEPELCHETFMLIAECPFALLAPCIHAAHTLAPNASWIHRTLDHEPMSSLLQGGEKALAFGRAPNASTQLRHEVLFEQDLVCVARRGHNVLCEDVLDLETFLGLEHIHVSLRACQSVVVALQAQGATRRILLSTPDPLFAASILAGSECIAVLPRGVFETLKSRFDLSSCEIPLDVLRDPISMVWHKDLHNDPAHTWLRGVFREHVTRPS